MYVILKDFYDVNTLEHIVIKSSSGFGLVFFFSVRKKDENCT